LVVASSSPNVSLYRMIEVFISLLRPHCGRGVEQS
jgi:hypothetical protein